MLITVLACAEPAPSTNPEVIDTQPQNEQPPPPLGDPIVGLADTGSLRPELVSSEIAWDAMPPDGLPGITRTVVFTCALLLEPIEAVITKTDDAWKWDIALDGAFHIPGLEPCYAGSGNTPMFMWDPDPRITMITANGIIHLLEPVGRENLYAGEVWPAHVSTAACEEILAENGVGWPLPLTMEVLPSE